MYNNPNYQQPANSDPFTPGPDGHSRGIAGLLAIFLGCLGVQYFYLNRTTAGILAIVITVVTCGMAEILWFIQGILMLVMTQADFERKFINTTSTLPLF